VKTNGRAVSYEAFVSFFVKYIGLSADGYDANALGGGAPTLALETTYADGQATQVTLLERDGGSKYIQVDQEAGFYLADDQVVLLLDRLDKALAAAQ
jgi:hypothetical protein